MKNSNTSITNVAKLSQGFTKSIKIDVILVVKLSNILLFMLDLINGMKIIASIREI